MHTLDFSDISTMAESRKLKNVLRKLTAKKSSPTRNFLSLEADYYAHSSPSLVAPSGGEPENVSRGRSHTEGQIDGANVIIHTGNGRLVQLDRDGGYKSSEDLTSKDVVTTQPPLNSGRRRSVSLRHDDVTSSRRPDQPKSMELTGHASLSSSGLVFRTPVSPRSATTSATPSRPRGVADDMNYLRKAYSTPNVHRGPSLEESESDEAESETSSVMDWSDDDTSGTTSPTGRGGGVGGEVVDRQLHRNMEIGESPPDSKAQYIARELMTTEESYVNKLGILNMARTKTKDILGNDVAKEMFPYINSIYALHKENMLPDLKNRLQKWKDHPQIGDVMKKFAPFLKLYTDYVKNFDSALKLVDSWTTKSPDFSRMILDLPSNGATLNLKIQIKSHMLEPIQRVPRYRLLLQQYSKEIEENSTERADLEVALASVSQAADHFEERMKRGLMRVELLDLQRQVDTPVNLMATGRELVKQGKIGKVHAKTGKSVSRQLFLFNDLLMVCSEQTFYIPGLQPKYKCRHLMDIDGMQITEGNNLDEPYTFYVKTRKKALELSASDESEKTEWQEALWKVVGDKMREKLANTNTMNRRRTMMLHADGVLGKEAPVWVHNSQVSMCMTCGLDFKGFRKKHHCRACGAVVCSKCSSRSAKLEYDDNRERRVCDECYLTLEEQAYSRRRDSIYKARARAMCVHKGYLHVSSDRGKTWHKRWFEVQEGGNLYCYKLQQDISPISHVSGAVPTLLAADGGRGAPSVIHIEVSPGKSYWLREESQDKLNRWIEALIPS